MLLQHCSWRSSGQPIRIVPSFQLVFDSTYFDQPILWLEVNVSFRLYISYFKKKSVYVSVCAFVISIWLNNIRLRSVDLRWGQSRVHASFIMKEWPGTGVVVGRAPICGGAGCLDHPLRDGGLQVVQAAQYRRQKAARAWAPNRHPGWSMRLIPAPRWGGGGRLI